MDANEPAPTADDGGLRASLRAMWASAAPAWGEHADYVDTRGAVVAQAMLDAAGLQRGERVLELACGPGGVGIAAAEIVGPDGAVVLSDFAPEMTAIAAERAKMPALRTSRPAKWTSSGSTTRRRLSTRCCAVRA